MNCATFASSLSLDLKFRGNFHLTGTSTPVSQPCRWATRVRLCRNDRLSHRLDGSSTCMIDGDAQYPSVSEANSVVAPTPLPSANSLGSDCFICEPPPIASVSVASFTASTQSHSIHSMPENKYSDDQSALADATRLFRLAFGCEPTVAAAAPGRVNLIGEHVDYNDGFVFPFALELNTYIVAAPQRDGVTSCEIISGAYPGVIACFAPDDSPLPVDGPKWAAYVKGMVAHYSRNGYPVAPFRAAIVSAVPQGGGLSSSAALEMASAVTLEALMGHVVLADDRARMGQACEHEFAHVPCGIMDQLISSRAVRGHALLIDCRSFNAIPIPLDHPDVSLVVTNSRVTHELSGSEYPTRRNQCHSAATAIANLYPQKNITHLRDCSLEMLDAVAPNLDKETHMRARHVISEDRRTIAAAEALKKGDLAQVGRLMHESHLSLRDLFEVSTKEIDALVDMAMSVDGVYGSRITGGGFGGCTVTLAHKDSVDKLINLIHERYPAFSGGIRADVFATQAGTGARNLSHLLTFAV